MIKKIIKDNKKAKGLKFYTDENEYLQLGFHDHEQPRIGKIHGLKKIKPFVVNSIYKCLYVTKGKVKVDFYKTKDQIHETKFLKRGDSIIIGDVIHRVTFSKNSKAVEIKQGPYQND